MNKILLSICALFLLLAGLAPAAPAADDPVPVLTIRGGGLVINSQMLKAMKAAPLASAGTVFGAGAQEFNRLIDKQYSKTPKADRPYITPLRLAEMADSLVQSYRSGNRVLAEELAARVPVEGTVEEKVDFLETITKAYLAAEAKKSAGQSQP